MTTATALTLFLFGPFFGLLAIMMLAVLQEIMDRVLPQSKREQRLLLVAALSCEVIGFCLLSMIMGSAVLAFSVPLVLIAALFLAADDNNVFKQKVSWVYQIVVQEIENRGQNVESSRFSPVSEKGSVPESVETSNRVGPILCPRTSFSEQELLQELMAKIAQLQQWIARPESDRAAVTELTSEAQRLEEALNDAVLKLDTGKTDCKEIRHHIEGLSRHQLPSELSSALDELVRQRTDSIKINWVHVVQISKKLRSAADELKQKIATPVLSPADVINAADLALQSAEQVRAKHRQ